MKTTTLALIVLLTVPASWAQPASTPRRLAQRMNLATNAPAAPAQPSVPGAPAPAGPDAFPAPGTAPGAAPAAASDASAASTAAKPPEEIIPAGNINFQGVDVNQVLEVYAKLVGRTILRAGLPSAQIVLKTETPLTRTEAIEALQAVLALNGIAVVNIGDKFVKVGPVDQANSFGAEFNKQTARELPDMGSYVTQIKQLKFIKPSLMVPVIQPFAKLPNSILAIDDNGILVLRDNAENVKRMLEMIEQVDVSVPAVYTNEVIAIKYAMADDIANALNSLGGSGGSTVSFGGSGGASSVNGVSRPGGTGGFTGGGSSLQGLNNPNQARPYGTQTTPGGAPAGGNTFQQRLNSIMQRSGGGGQQDQIQVFGQAKIIADDRSNSLLVFATQEDMVRIKAVIAKLDVLLAQVLIEAIIMDVNLGSSLSYGVSAMQEKKNWGGSSPVQTAGVMNNNQPFYNFINNVASNGVSGTGSGVLSGLASTPANNFSYFGNIGNNWDLALQAAAADNNATVIQRPRIQTSQAKAATFFVGNTVPYVTGTYYGGGYSGGNSSQYSQLSVGVELDVTPFINPDGLVVMQINQEIDDVNGYTSIDGNQVPNTDKRTLSSEIAVRDRDTIILGGFIRSDKSKTQSGVPILKDIPVLGALFSARSSSKNREELIVLMRPTVLKTPELASAQTIREGQRLPGVSAAAAEEEVYERKLADAERKREMRNARVTNQKGGFYTMPLAPESTNTAPAQSGPNPAPAPVLQ